MNERDGMNEKAEESELEKFLILIEFLSRPFFFTATSTCSDPEDLEDGGCSTSAKKRILGHFQQMGGDDAIHRRFADANQEMRKDREKLAKIRTYVKFSCCSFASVSEAAAPLPQCSRNLLFRLPSPAVTAASPGSLADLRTKDHTRFSD